MGEELLNYFLKTRGVKKILDIFSTKKIDIRFVGGCIRDALLNIHSKDIDFAINCDPDQTLIELRKNNIKYNDYGKKYGSVLAIIDNNKFEITSLREDYNQKGRDTDIKFTNNWQKDALRRDFTMNAIYLSSEGIIFDYFNGKNDLLNQSVRFIGNIEEKIKQDYLRIFRFYRFLGCFKELKILSDYKKIIVKLTPNIKQYIKNDIMRIELLKMFNKPYPINSFRDFDNPKQKNDLIININQWWIEEKYDIGIKKCVDRINKYF